MDNNFHPDGMDRTTVLVMNTTTWEQLKSEMLEIAPTHDDPIEYLGKKLKGMDVVIDQEVQDGMLEIYERWAYDAIKKGEY